MRRLLPCLITLALLLSGCGLMPWTGSDNADAKRELAMGGRADSESGTTPQTVVIDKNAGKSPANSVAPPRVTATDTQTAQPENKPVAGAPEAKVTEDAPLAETPDKNASAEPKLKEAPDAHNASEDATQIAEVASTASPENVVTVVDSAVPSAAEAPIDPEPDVDEETQAIRSQLVGWWYGNQPTTKGGRIEWIRDSRNDGMYLDRIRIHNSDGSITERKEIGQWGVVEDTCFTIVKSRTEDGRAETADQSDVENYSAYTLEELEPGRVVMRGKANDNLYMMERVESGFTFEDAETLARAED